jgi:hypothetical protein
MTSDSNQTAVGDASPEGRLGRILLWALLAVLIVSFPSYPKLELDSSWRMAYGWFFQQRMQIGRDVVFTYGPLGFLMWRTYSGLQFSSLILWGLFESVVFAGIIVANARNLRGFARFAYFLFFALLGVIYEDARHMIIIALLGWELVRCAGGPARRSTALIALLLALLGMIKFTNLMLGGFIIIVTSGYELWRRRPRAALALSAWFFGGYIALWILCRQNPLNLPLYLINFLEISRGYDAAMGLPTPPDALWKALAVLGALAAYGGLYLRLHPDRPRALAFAAILGAFLFLNWKQGFVRSDGHMIGFFICALVPAAAFPVLLEDAPKWRALQRLLLAIVAVFCVAGIYDAIPFTVRDAAAGLENKVWDNVDHIAHWRSFCRSYDDRLREQKQQYDLPRVRDAVHGATIDVLGFEQAIALFNDLNYRPRPVIQSYTVYTPRLSHLNYAFYLSPRAPEYALLKIQTIDNRLPSLDDSLLLNLFVHYYRYVLSERGYQLWQRRAELPDPATLAPRRLRTATVGVNAPYRLEDLAGRPVWATIDLSLSLLGRLRSFLYKPPFVKLAIEQTDGRRSEYNLPLLQGRTGFILSPVVEDVMGYMGFAGGKPEQWVRSITVAVEKDDLRYFSDQARISLFALTPSTAGAEYFQRAAQARFWMFKTPPMSFSAFAAPSETEIDGHKAIVMHAPSEMEFGLPRGATQVSGAFGFVPGAYENGGRTDGAEFRVVWTNGSEQVVVYSRLLNPHDVPADRGLQTFDASLKNLAGGQLRLEVNPGPHSDTGWDWTAWTDIEIK